MQRLFKYIDGGNEDEVKIPMTSPVLVDVEPSCGPFCKNNFTVSFFVPFNFQVISIILSRSWRIQWGA